MAIETIADLRQYLEKWNLSPETLSEHVPISNMTIRRLLAKDPKTRIPERYRPAFAMLEEAKKTPPQTLPFSIEENDFAPFIKTLEAAGSNIRSKNQLKEDIKAKLKETPVKSLRAQVKFFLHAMENSLLDTRSKRLLTGALVYFLNPFDCVPDAMLGVGYLDDLGVFSLVTGLLKGSSVFVVKAPTK